MGLEAGSLNSVLATLPAKPGVYLFKGERGQVLYVGKAKSLRGRVRSYFQAGADLADRTRALVSQVRDLEFIVAPSEVDALILEGNLIKKHRPRFNVLLRDDKTYPYLRFSVQEPYPRLTVVRRVTRDGAAYFGPYTAAGAMRETLEYMQKLFPLATCAGPIDGKSPRPCVEYEIGRCLGPCCAQAYRGGYGEAARQARLFLEGRSKDLLSSLRSQMREAADALRFEEAAEIRDRLDRIEKVLAKQVVVSPTLEDQDVIGIAREGTAADIQVLYVRGGRLLGRREVFLADVGDRDDAALLSGLLPQIYREAAPAPKEVLVPVLPPDVPVLAEYLARNAGSPVRLFSPRRGRKRRLVQMAEENARAALSSRTQRGEAGKDLAKEVMGYLGLSRLPRRVEAFDVSNIHGAEAVGAMIVWEDDRPKKDEYLRFRIKTVSGADDFAMMEEIVARRYRKAVREESPLPDLVLIDGGKGQISSALCGMAAAGVAIPDVVGLAKARGEKEERIYFPGASEPLPLPADSPVTHFLMRVRDEVHRFAVSYHRGRREAEVRFSVLDKIPGIGAARKKRLFLRFGSVENIIKASEEDLVEQGGLPADVAARVRETLRRSPAGSTP
ncbi:MAG: excinuclease ABC subunit C [Nitrospirae bacterium RBG_16_64_22]|nr:MAG: excinuclease ABC subunit C [Nitrospirae bacterium RBG_16_64_22]